jgi:hypothetical protein
MDVFNCKLCKLPYDKNIRKAFMLECGHSACSKCINFYKDSGKETFECGVCCNDTKATNFENKSLYSNINNQNANPIQQPSIGEFEIMIRKKNSPDKFTIIVRKEMTVGQLKEKIKQQEGIDSSTYELSFKKPLTDTNKTLESYGITRTVTITSIAPFDGGLIKKNICYF